MALILAPRAANANLTSLGDEEEEALHAALCRTLRTRFTQCRSPYTDLGPSILCSINPYSQLSAEGGGLGLYDCAAVYRGSAPLTLPPHLYAIGELCARGVAAGTPQAVVISGESGSGKTEAARVLISYLAGSATPPAVTERLQAGALFLEAFGNAATVNNKNSSRFGKLTELAMSASHAAVTAGKVSVFLLETHRVTAQTLGERSFHILHYLEAGAPAPLRAELRLPAPGHPWRFLRATPADTSDSASWRGLCGCLQRLAIPPAQAAEWWRVLAAVLHLGELQVSEGAAGTTTACTVEGSASVDAVCALLGVPPSALAAALTTAQAAVGGSGEVITRNLSLGEARVSISSLARQLYSQLFAAVVGALNGGFPAASAAASASASASSGVAVLDLYGFESLGEENRLETLLINTANEGLHAFFCRKALEEELALFQSEEVPYTPVHVPASTTLACLWGRPGVFSLLQDFSTKRAAFGSEAAAAEGGEGKGKHKGAGEPLDTALQAHLKGNASFLPSPAPSRFSLKHYAGVVQYSTEGLAEADVDRSGPALALLRSATGLPHLQQALAAAPETAPTPASASTTLSSAFKHSLDALQATLALRKISWVRCIRSNGTGQALTLEPERLARQVSALSLPSAVRLLRSGWQAYLPFDTFLARFAFLLPKELQGSSWKAAPPKQAVGHFLAKIGLLSSGSGSGSGSGGGSGSGSGGGLIATPSALARQYSINLAGHPPRLPGAGPEGAPCPPDAYALGTTRVFFRASATLAALELARAIALASLGALLLRLWQGHAARVAYATARARIARVQALSRAFLARRALRRARAAVRALQAWARGCALRATPPVAALRSALGLRKSSGGKVRRAASLLRLTRTGCSTGSSAGALDFGGVRGGAQVPASGPPVAQAAVARGAALCARAGRGGGRLLLSCAASKLHLRLGGDTGSSWKQRLVLVIAPMAAEAVAEAEAVAVAVAGAGAGGSGGSGGSGAGPPAVGSGGAGGGAGAGAAQPPAPPALRQALPSHPTLLTLSARTGAVRTTPIPITLLTGLFMSPFQDDVVTLQCSGKGRTHDLTLCTPHKTALCTALQKAFRGALGTELPLHIQTTWPLRLKQPGSVGVMQFQHGPPVAASAGAGMGVGAGEPASARVGAGEPASALPPPFAVAGGIVSMTLPPPPGRKGLGEILTLPELRALQHMGVKAVARLRG